MRETTPFGIPWEPRFLSHVPNHINFLDLSRGHKNDANRIYLLYVYANIANFDFEVFYATRTYRQQIVLFTNSEVSTSLNSL